MRISNRTLREYFQAEDILRNEGYIDKTKLSGNIRILSLNPYGYKPNEISKMNTLQKAVQKYDIDIIMMNEMNTK